MRTEPEISSVSITLLGDFNPAIFTPAWFALHKLLSQGEADSADLQVAHQQVTSFTADWLQFQVTTDRFSAATHQAPHVRVSDLVVRVFKDHLYHTPLRAFGINREVHVQLGSAANLDRIGRILAPVEPWGTWGKELGLDGKYGGMTSLTMTRTAAEGRPAGGAINITIEPSNRIGEGQSGVYVRVNDHYAINDTNPGVGERLMGLLESNFDASLERSHGIIDHIVSLAKQ